MVKPLLNAMLAGLVLAALGACSGDDASGPSLGPILESTIAFSVQRIEGGQSVSYHEPAQLLAGDGVTAELVVRNVGDQSIDVALAEWRWGPTLGPPEVIAPENGLSLTLPPGGQITEPRSFTIPSETSGTAYEVRWIYSSPDTVFVRAFGVAPN